MAFPRARARGLIEALRLQDKEAHRRGFPRARARGLIEAPETQSLTLDRLNFRERALVAPFEAAITCEAPCFSPAVLTTAAKDVQSYVACVQ